MAAPWASGVPVGSVVMGYQVSTPVFEGPFDLLLHLVTKHEVDIWELSLTSIVDEYVAALEDMQSLDLSVATEFLLIAAVLLELKARRLLPDPGAEVTEEELALWEERDLLLARLLECKTFKDASVAMSHLMDRAALSQPRLAGMEERFLALAPDPLAGVTAQRIRDAALRALAPRPAPRVNTDHVAPVRVSVAETVQVLVDVLPVAGRTTFRRLTADLSSQLEVIVYFLALLELYKRGLLELEQASKLAELHVTWTGAAEVAMGSFEPPKWDAEPAGSGSSGSTSSGTTPVGGTAGPVAVIDVTSVEEYEG
ncbi:MAG: segregation and condensation protein A [Acidimicrobiales bacterium]